MELARNLKVESVSRLRPAPPLCSRPEQTVAEAVVLMRSHRTGCVLVCRGDGELVGIFTERDLMRRVLALGRSMQTTRLEECMPRDVCVVQLNEPISSAVRRMQEGGYRHLPVVDGSGRAIGILSVKRIVHYLVEHFPSTIYCLPPDPSVFPHEREGA